jgi:molybdopterin molybdotransferase
MIPLHRALDIIRSVTSDLRVETVLLEDALGRVLPRQILSPIDSPPFDKSAMDGFAVRGDEDSTELRVVESVAAGGVPARRLGRGECTRIMTGAMLPPGSGRVIRRENVKEDGGMIRVLSAEKADNVIHRGASIKAGQPVLKPGVIGPRETGALAASGVGRVEISASPRIAILCTGPEIRPAGSPLRPGEIYDSNGPQLRALLAEMRCPAALLPGVEDSVGALTAAIVEAVKSCDVLLLTGGVSAGDFDHVPGCLRELGAEILFHGVAIKPGKPVLFARRGGQHIFGLPGNPVSTFVTFEVFVKPFLYRRMGIDWVPALRQGALSQAVTRSSAGRTEFLPVRLRQGRVELVSYNGSSHLNALLEADGFVTMDAGIHDLEEGMRVDVRPL